MSRLEFVEKKDNEDNDELNERVLKFAEENNLTFKEADEKLRELDAKESREKEVDKFAEAEEDNDLEIEDGITGIERDERTRNYALKHNLTYEQADEIVQMQEEDKENTRLLRKMSGGDFAENTKKSLAVEMGEIKSILDSVFEKCLSGEYFVPTEDLLEIVKILKKLEEYQSKE